MTSYKQTRPGEVSLLSGSAFYQRLQTDKAYLKELDVDQLLQNHYNEAGLGTEIYSFHASNRYGGWEYAASHQRGHFIGHWLSAASRIISTDPDILLKGKIDYVVDRLAECQKENGGEWVFAIPPKYLDWAVKGKTVWAPHYNIHKTLMGLLDAFNYAGNEQALSILLKAADWFFRYMSALTDDERDALLDVETGGMLEAWADLYAIAPSGKTRALIDLYRHRRLEDRLFNHPDPLLNRHANTTIPEMMGYCRAYDVTGEQLFLDIAMKYWHEAVDIRPAFVTGARNLAEAWTGTEDMSGRLGHSTSEQCTGYNMCRLARYLYKFTGDRKYPDYIELTLYNSTLAQCFWEGYLTPCGIQTEPGKSQTGVCYYLPLIQGGKKPWGTKFDSFWCCYGTGVQACASFQEYIYSRSDAELRIEQYIPSVCCSAEDDLRCSIRELSDNEETINLFRKKYVIETSGTACALLLRIPEWADHWEIRHSSNGSTLPFEVTADNYIRINPEQSGQAIVLTIYCRIIAEKLKGTENLYGFRIGPVALAALSDHSEVLRGNAENLSTVFHRSAEYEFTGWQNKLTAWTMDGRLLEFMPLYDIAYDTYTVYHALS